MELRAFFAGGGAPAEWAGAKVIVVVNMLLPPFDAGATLQIRGFRIVGRFGRYVLMERQAAAIR